MGFLESLYSKQWVVFGTVLVPLLFLFSLCLLRDTPASAIPLARPFAMHTKALPLEVGTTLAHYAASKVTPQQTFEEIMLTVRVLAKRAPCNFLVFGLGYDSALWKALNHGGRTVFLVNYNTKLADADGLLKHARKKRKGACRPVQDIKNSTWDVIMVDAPRGYFAAAPGRMYDVDRPVERQYCDEFLCKANLVAEAPTKRLRHYRLHPKSPSELEFC